MAGAALIMTASAGSAMHDVCAEARRRLSAPGVSDTRALAAFLDRQHDRSYLVTADSAPGQEQRQYSMHAFGAVYNATGVRVRDLPITLDKVIGGQRAVR